MPQEAYVPLDAAKIDALLAESLQALDRPVPAEGVALVREVLPRVRAVRRQVETIFADRKDAGRAVHDAANLRTDNTASHIEQGVEAVGKDLLALEAVAAEFTTTKEVATAALADDRTAALAFARISAEKLSKDLESLTAEFRSAFQGLSSEKDSVGRVRAAMARMEKAVEDFEASRKDSVFRLIMLPSAAKRRARVEDMLRAVAACAKECLTCAPQEFIPHASLDEAHAAWLRRAMALADETFSALAARLLRPENHADAQAVYARPAGAKLAALKLEGSYAPDAPSADPRRKDRPEFAYFSPVPQLSGNFALKPAFELLYALRRLRLSLSEVNVEKLAEVIARSNQARRSTTHLRESA